MVNSSGIDSGLKDFLKKYPELIICPQLNPNYVIADSKRSNLLQPEFFYYEVNNRAYYHCSHKLPILETPYFQLRTPYGCGGGGGGPVSTSDDCFFINEAFDAYHQWCKQNNIVFEKIHFHPLANNWQYYYGRVYFFKNNVFVNIEEDSFFNSYRNKERTSIRKAIKNNVMVRLASLEEFLSFFPKMHHAAMNVKTELLNFNNNYFEAICKLDMAYNFIATHEDQIVAGAIFFIQDKICEYHMAASSDLGKQLNASSLLLHEALMFAKNKGCALAYLGGGKTVNPDDSLLFYKLGFAGQIVPDKLGHYVHNLEIYSKL